MNTRTALAVLACVVLVANPASAHRIDEYLQATMVSLEADGLHASLHASMRLIPGVSVAPAMLALIDSNGDGTLSATEQRSYAERVLADLTLTVDGKTAQPHLISWNFPEPAEMLQGLGEIHIEYSASLPGSGADHSLILVNRHWSAGSVYLFNAEVPVNPRVRIVDQKRNAQQSLYELDYQQADAGLSAASAGVWTDRIQWQGLFHLGMRHIAEGPDHLLFLLTLLLPAPLLACGGRWGRPASLRRGLVSVLSIVTAFTLGHSLTLTLAAMGSLHVANRPVEVLIAVSIFVSAVHALRPLLPGKEAYVAGLFGLIHGLAFAATLDRLGLGGWERLGGILSFNLGIEVMQMMVVAAVLPSLMLLSRTRAYSWFRIRGAVCAGSLRWRGWSGWTWDGRWILFDTEFGLPGCFLALALCVDLFRICGWRDFRMLKRRMGVGVWLGHPMAEGEGLFVVTFCRELHDPGNGRPTVAPHISRLKNAGIYPDFLYAAQSRAACAAFSKESRMRRVNAAEVHRKSGSGAPAFVSGKGGCCVPRRLLVR